VFIAGIYEDLLGPKFFENGNCAAKVEDPEEVFDSAAKLSFLRNRLGISELVILEGIQS